MIRSESHPDRAASTRRLPSVTTQIFIGLALGIVVGYLWPSHEVNGQHVAGFAEQIKPLADAFLRMIKMIIAPLLFSTLVVGIAGTGDLKSMGRIGFKAIATTNVEARFVFRDVDEFLAWSWSTAGRGLLEQLNNTDMGTYRTVCADALAAHATDDGYEFRQTVELTTATPGAGV